MLNQSNKSNDLTLEQAQIQCAISLAQLSLFGKLDKQGKPLFDHVCRVADKVKARGLHHEQIVAAYLHDTIEDSYVTLSSIDNIFEVAVSRLVGLLTRGQEESYSDYIERLSYSRMAIDIKLCDLEDNLDPSRGPIPDSLKARYIKAKEYLEGRLRKFEKERS